MELPPPAVEGVRGELVPLPARRSRAICGVSAGRGRLPEPLPPLPRLCKIEGPCQRQMCRVSGGTSSHKWASHCGRGQGCALFSIMSICGPVVGSEAQNARKGCQTGGRTSGMVLTCQE